MWNADPVAPHFVNNSAVRSLRLGRRSPLNNPTEYYGIATDISDSKYTTARQPSERQPNSLLR